MAWAYSADMGGVVGIQTPGVVTGRYVSGTLVASFARSARTAAAACSPIAMPAVFAGPSGIGLSAASNASSTLAFWAG